MRVKNWSGNLEYNTDKIFHPSSIEEVQAIVKENRKVRGLGSRHSFNTIADSSDVLISSDRLNNIVALDTTNHTITVEAGMKYGEVCQYLHEHGYAFHNLASLPHISIAGSIATATHGSGVANGNLSTAVSRMEFIDANGNVITLSKGDELFYGAVVGLGGLGMVTKITLDLIPTFAMRQVVYRNLSMHELRNNFINIMSAGYSVSLFTDWKNENISEVWIKDKIEGGRPGKNFNAGFYDAKRSDVNLHPIEDQPAENCTEQCSVPGPWFERLPHFKMGFTPSAGKELQSEYFIPIENAYEALLAVGKINHQISPHIFISEIRTIAADNLWMSPCYGKPCVAIHTTWRQTAAVAGLLPLMEKQLEPFDPLPHWGKLFTMKPAVLQKRVKRLADFKTLLKTYDPNGKFRNDFIEEYLFSKLNKE